MFKILSGTIIVTILLVGLVFLFGWRAGPEINTTFFVTMDYPADYLFDMITDITEYPDRKNKLNNIEVLEKKGIIIIKWRENYSKGVWREYEIVEKDPPRSFAIRMIDSSDSHSGLISYQLIQRDDLTEILLTEEGRIDNTFWRGLHYIAGEDSFLEKQVKWLRVAIVEELIGRS